MAFHRNLNWLQLVGAFAVGWLGLYYSLHPERAYQSFLHGPSLIIHEAGHFIWAPFGWFFTVVGGSLTQVLLPLAFSVYFWRTGQRYAAFIVLFWVGFNLLEVAVYMGDASARQLPLITDEADPERESHDWYQILSHYNHLSWDKPLYAVTWLLGSLCNLAAIGGSFVESLGWPQKQIQASELEQLHNLGPRAAQMLSQIGIQSHFQLAQLGAPEVFKQLQQAGFAVNPVMLLALHGAITGQDWQTITPEETAWLKKKAGLE